MINIDAKVYSEFKCKADKCKHSCCKGWEIDIDEDTLDYYKSLDTELGNEIRENIHEGDDTFFKLTSDGRCPFLKDSGLCKIIEELGEDGLCDICRLHPRFFESINDFSLAGVGLSCEKSSELLFEKSSLEFIICDNDKIISFKELLELLNLSIPEECFKPSNVIKDYLDEVRIERILDIFYNTEPIDDSWINEVLMIKKEYKDHLDLLRGENADKYEIIYEYILFRQLELVEDYGIKNIISYAACSIIFIMLYESSFHDNIEAVRRWSEQIEYNEDNTAYLLKEVAKIDQI